MKETEAEEFRKQAEECRQLAEQTISPLDKEAWLRLADEWMRLAREAEARQSRCRLSCLGRAGTNVHLGRLCNSEHLRLLGIWGHVDKRTDQT
jgi:hypothetical protein